MTGTKTWTTPSVYLTESGGFPPSVIGVQTSVPVFIGYSEMAVDPASLAPLYLQAVPITSMADYTARFGGRYRAPFAVRAGTAAAFDFEAYKSDGSLGYFNVTPAGTARFNLFAALTLFYANGGGACFVVSVANYQGERVAAPDPTKPAVAVAKSQLMDGLSVAQDTTGPSILVVPDACLLASAGDYGDVAAAQVKQAGTLQDRVAILDLHGAMDPAQWTKAALAAQRDAFYDQIAPAAPWYSYGTAYAPALRTTVLSAGDVDYTDLAADAASAALLKALLLWQSADLYSGSASQKAQIDAKIAQAFPATPPTPPPTPQQIRALDQDLTAALPLLAQIETILVEKLNVAPPSGAVAGVWVQTDMTRGVWHAPANVACASVTAPVVLLTDADQGAYNLPLNGVAIDILRSFVNRGTVVWGARTLDGDSNDYRYIQVRRTIVYIEQSIKTALQPFVFAANDGKTWTTVTAMIASFLTTLWKQGGLMGDKPSSAFSVQCGLGSTMTGEDILNGYLIVQVQVAMTYPAEFIVLTFQQKMDGV